MKTLVLGIGNTLLGDDGVGIHAVREVADRITREDVTVLDVGTDGLNLLEVMMGYDRMIVIDAIVTENGDIGRIYCLRPEQLYAASGFSVSPHHFNLASTLAIGRKLFPGEIPEDVTVFAVDTLEATEITEEMTGKVREAIPGLVSRVIEKLN